MVTRVRLRRLLSSGCIAGAIAVAHVATAQEAESSHPEFNHFTVLEENDSLFFNSDKHYTQGLRLSYAHAAENDDGSWLQGFANDLATRAFLNDPQGTSEYAVFFGQSIFTPTDKSSVPPDPHDRAYAGWAYVGFSLLEEKQGTLDNAEIDLGVVGPPALGKQVQNDFHQFIGAPLARGWSSQLQTEPGAMVSYERLWRVPLTANAETPGAFGIDIVPQVGGTVGNVFTYAETGALLRIGTGLGADYGPVRIRPALSGTDYFDPRGLVGIRYYFSAGVQGRVIGHNIFLDGNTDRSSPNVDKRPLVGDAQGGFTLLWSKHVRTDISVVLRSKEFYGQKGVDDICTAAFHVTW